MVSRMVLCWLYLISRDIIFVLEQPSNSLMPSHPRIAGLQKLVRLFDTSTWMGCYGAGSAKATMLLSNSKLVHMLHRSLVRAEHKFDADGIVVPAPSGGVSGGPNLTSTQEYPFAYAEEVLNVFRATTDFKTEHVPSKSDASPDAVWDDVGAQSLASWAGVPVDRLII